MTPSVINNMPATDYFAVPALSSSGAKKILRSPAHFMSEVTTPKPATAAMQFGTAVHAGVLEPHTFAEAVKVAPDVDRRTKAGKEEYAAFMASADNAIVLSPDDFDRARRCIDAVMSHPAASHLLAGAQTEMSLFWQDGQYKVPCKARFDAWNHGGLIDLKTTQDASPEAFGKTCASFQYHLQGGFYGYGAEHVLNQSPEFYIFIAAETEPPFGVGVYSMPTAAILAGQRLANEALARYAAALAADAWPSYPNTVEALPFPKWALRFDL